MAVMITHRGRKTGRIRQTILEVAHYDLVTREYVIGAAYGSRTDWYQNILAHPALSVQVGRQRYVPLQRQLTPEEALTILRDYQQRHPWLFRQCTRLFGFPNDGTDESLLTLSRAIPGMAFRPSQQE
jgi:deazaflavin-dependent oxidoreductase (nitroreductase family)